VKKSADLSMLAKKKNTAQISFYGSFDEQLNSNHSLYKLANTINWAVFDEAFSHHYNSTQGRPAKPIRRMVSLLILKQLRNLSDESVVEQWEENSYYQYFSGELIFVAQSPCSSTELVEFRKRIGSEGIALIFKESIRVNGKDSDDDNISIDTDLTFKLQ
jgi:transposase, IS5 family